MIDRGIRILLLTVRFSVVAILVGCVFLSVLPRFAISSAAGVNSCCLGKSAGHCKISLRKVRKALKAEPMCGLKQPSPAEDNVTATANESEGSADPQTAFTSPDHCGDCPTCSLASKQRTRDKAFIPAQEPIRQDSKVTLLLDACPNSFRARSQFNLVSQRGPPRS